MLSDIQHSFAKDVNKLFSYLIDHKIKFTIGEVWRRESTQAWLYKQGFSKTLRSSHLRKLAIDLFFWKDATFLENDERTKLILIPVANYWKGLNKHNYWGGNFSGFLDTSHFGRRKS